MAKSNHNLRVSWQHVQKAPIVNYYHLKSVKEAIPTMESRREKKANAVIAHFNSVTTNRAN
jgi:hypothetical protein